MNCSQCRIPLAAPIVADGIVYYVCDSCGDCLTRPDDADRENPEALLARFEKEWRRPLPQAYKDWVVAHYRRETQWSYLQVPPSLVAQFPYYLGDGWLEYDGFFGVDLDAFSLFDSKKLVEEWDLPEALVLIHGAGHTWTALDYRNTDDEPPVIFIESEEQRSVILAERFSILADNLKDRIS